MHLASFQADSPSFSIPCMVSVPQQDWHVAGIIWGLSAKHLHVECPVAASPGMTVSLFFIYPGTDEAFHLDEALVTWVRGHEFGFGLVNVQAGETVRLEQYVIGQIR